MQPPDNSIDKFESPYVVMWMEGNILCARYADDLHVSLEVAKAVVASRIFFTKSTSHPALIDMKGVKSTTKEARQYLASVGGTLVKAAALITGSAVNKALGNMFLTIDKPQVPSRIFTNEEKARQWLSQYL